MIILKVPSFPDDVAMALIEKELGRPCNDVYSELTSSPIAAGRLLSCTLSCQVTFPAFGCLFCLYDVETTSNLSLSFLPFGLVQVSGIIDCNILSIKEFNHVNS